MKTFKQFLVEGGKATADLGTTRANKEDIQAAVQYVAKVLGQDAETLKSQILGSGRLTLGGHKQDSGDVDIAIKDDTIDQQTAISKMEQSTGEKAFLIGGSTASFAVPVNGKKVQVDLMFVPDVEWAKFSHYASEHSKYKSAVRNELLHSLLKFSMEPGKDLRLENDAARASRSYNLERGVERIFKIKPLRKDGSGARVKGSVSATPEQVQAVLDQEGVKQKFSPEKDTVRDPNKFAEMLLGKGASAKDLMSTEQIINMIKKRRKDANQVLHDAKEAIKRRGFEMPSELN